MDTCYGENKSGGSVGSVVQIRVATGWPGKEGLTGVCGTMRILRVTASPSSRKLQSMGEKRGTSQTEIRGSMK